MIYTILIFLLVISLFVTASTILNSRMERQKVALLFNIVNEIPTSMLREVAASKGTPVSGEILRSLKHERKQDPTEGFGSRGHVIFIYGETHRGGIEIRKMEFR